MKTPLRAQWLMVAAAIWSAACGSSKPVAVQAVSPKTATPRAASNQVELSEAAQKEAGLAAEAVVVRSLPETIHATGRLTFDEVRSWHVGAITDGRVVKVDVNAGDRVKEGQVLARMHSHDVHESRATFQKSKMEMARLTLNEGLAQRSRDRARRLYELKAASLEQVDHAETELKNAQSAVKQAEVEVERARIHITDFLGLALEDHANHKDGDDDDLIPIKAPAAGTVTMRNVTVGTVLQAGNDAFLVSDLSSVWMIAAVAEENLGRLRVGMPVRVSVQAYHGQTFAGKLAKLGEQLDPATRTVQARVELANSRALLKPEMYADAEFDLPGRRPGLFVPETAIQELKGQNAVFIRKSALLFEARPIETGQSANGMVEILHGLGAGDLVVAKGAFLLKSQMLKSALAEE